MRKQVEGVNVRRTALWMTLMELGAKTGCHQKPERSFFVKGCQLPLCARCTGIFLGQICGGMISVIRTPSPVLSALMLLPCALDGGLQLTGVRASTNRRRLLTGILAGVGVSFLYGRLIKEAIKFIRK